MKGNLFFRLNLAQLYILCVVVSTLGAAVPSVSLADAESSELEEMVVTARRREEGLQDTPIAVSAFTGERLEEMGITMITRLQDMTPNLVFQNTPTNSGVGSNAVIFIRGVGQKDFAPTTDPGVGIYVDGVFLARTVGSVFDMIDLEQVEVLRGPQGTLYGRNTIGGAILLTTKKPNETQSGQFDIKYGTDNRLNIRGAANIPLTDNFFMRASVAMFKQDGYVTRPYDDLDLGNQDDATTRVAFRWLPAESLEVNFAFDYGKYETNGHPVVITRVDTPDDTPDSFVTGHNAFAGADANGLNPYNCWVPGAPERCYNNSVIGGRHINYGSGPNFSDIKNNGETLTIDWALSDKTNVKSITAWRNISGDFAVDGDGAVQVVGQPWFPIPDGPVVNPLAATYDTYEQDQFSEELSIGGLALNDRLKWMVGLYYFTEDGENLNPVDFFPVSIQSGGFFDYESKAAFAQATYNITEPWSVTAGLRYTDDDRDYTPDQYFEVLPLGPLGFPCFDPAFHIPCVVGDRVLPYETYNNSGTETTPLLSTAYQWTDVMAYFSYTEGYKNGGFTQRIFPPEPSLPAFDPEYVASYEAGFKSELLDGAMRLNGAVFYMDYTDMQLLVSDASRIGPFTTNAGDAVMKGAELELNWIPADGWRVDFSVGYLDPSYESLTPGAEAAGLTLDSPFTLISDWNFNTTIQKLVMLSNGSSLLPLFNWSYRSGFYTNANGLPFRDVAPPLYQPGYHLINLSLRWNSPSNQMFFTVGLDNATDKEYRTYGDYQPGFGIDQEAFDRGRQWYVMAGYSF